MMALPMKTLELHYPMIQFLIISVIPYPYKYLVSYPLSLKLFCQLSLIPNTPSRASKLVSDVWTVGQHVLVIANKSKRALFTWFICTTLHKMGDASQLFFKFNIKAVHNCPAVRDISSIAHKDTKNKQNKTEERADKLGFVQAFPFVHRFLFLLFFSSVSVL